MSTLVCLALHMEVRGRCRDAQFPSPPTVVI